MDRFDYSDGDFLYNMGGGMMMDSEGHMIAFPSGYIPSLLVPPITGEQNVM